MSEQYVVKFPGLPYFWGYFIKLCYISYFLFFLSTESSSCVNSLSLMSNLLKIIFVIGSCVTFRGFPSKFSKCCLHMCIRSSWLVAFSEAFAVPLLLLPSFTVCHAILYCLSSTEYYQKQSKYLSTVGREQLAVRYFCLLLYCHFKMHGGFYSFVKSLLYIICALNAKRQIQ